ncbi:hypothetical protein E9529_04465 [Blastococcus sp. KM273128]|uniref:restriction endonuclease subunit S n=1 Tax=Blastococcus sp. KM273128 TaxID=2570314 RepID=UPI001F1DFA26|nr:restriction endonuclease subunit S [Blastococcus sp. KM273128]MCF6743537.1 hypothetical protein [Blastococcus sp. KM273128]
MSGVQRRLDEVCVITMGQAPPGDSYNNDGRGWPLVAGAGDFSGDGLSVKKFTTAPSKLCAQGDILLSIRASIGAKVWADGEYCVGRGVAALRSGPDLHQRFLWHWLTENESKLAAKGRGATFLQVNRNDIGEMPIEVPPLDEQGRIAEILDRVDALRAQRRRALTTLDPLVHSLLNDVLQDGGTVERKLGEVADFFAGSSLPEGETYTGQGSGYLLMKVSDMNRPGNERAVETCALWSAHPGSRSATCPAGSIVIPKRGGAIGTNKKRIVVRPTVLDPNLMAITPKMDLDLQYLFAWFLSFDLATIASGSSVPQLNKQDLSPLVVPVPSPRRQQEFADAIEGVEVVSSRHRQQLAVLDEMSAALRARAFSGTL